MGGGSQRNSTAHSSDRDGPAAPVCGQQRSYLQPKQRQERRQALAIFGSLVKQRFVNSALFTLAGTFLKRMKQYFQTRWQQQQYVPRARHVSECTYESSGVGDEEIVERVTFNTNPYMSQSAGCAMAQELLVLDFNANANTLKIPKKRPVARPRRTVGGPFEKPRHKQDDKLKRDKCRRSGISSEESKKTPPSVKESVTSSAGDNVVQRKFSETDDQLSVGTREEGTNQHEEPQSQQIKFTQYSHFGECSTSDNSLSYSWVDNVTVFEIGLNNETENQIKPNKSTRLKPKAPPNVKDVNPKKDVRTERLESKSLSRQHVTKGIRQKLESRNCVTSLPPKVWQSNLSFNSNAENITDWPSLAELGRPKSLIKEAATEVVRRKYSGSGVRDTGSGVSDASSSIWDAGTLLKDFIHVESEQSDASGNEKESFNWTVQQKCTPNASQRTWASVAAQSLAGTVSDQRMSETYQTPTSETKENTPACNSPSVVSLLKIRKPPIRSKLAYSIKLSGDPSKIKEKLTLGKFMAERQESAKFLKSIRGKNTVAKHIGQKDQSEKRRSRKAETSEKTDENVAHLLGTDTPKSCWQHIWRVDEMPMVYACAIPPVIVLAGQPVSECENNRESQLTAESSNRETSLSVAADSPNATADVHVSMSTNTSLLPDNIQSDSRDDQHDELIVASSSSGSSLEIKAEISAPVETEAKSPKKVSVRYRALLRNDSSRLNAKTLTEMQTRNKKTNHLHDNKVATRERQRQQRQERQTTHYDALRFHTSTCLEDPNQSCQSGPAQITCPYWLRSMPPSREFGLMHISGNMQSNREKDQKDGCPEVSNKVKITPCRRSDRLRAKSKNMTLSSYFRRCPCLDWTGH